MHCILALLYDLSNINDRKGNGDYEHVDVDFANFFDVTSLADGKNVSVLSTIYYSILHIPGTRVVYELVRVQIGRSEGDWTFFRLPCPQFFSRKSTRIVSQCCTLTTRRTHCVVHVVYVVHSFNQSNETPSHG